MESKTIVAVGLAIKFVNPAAVPVVTPRVDAAVPTPAHVASPRQKVVALAPVPELKLFVEMLPVTSVDKETRPVVV